MKPKNSAIFFDSVETALGTFRMAATARGLVGIDFPNGYAQGKKRKAISRPAKRILNQTKHFLRAYLQGKRLESIQIPVDWRIFSPFDRRVLKALKKIRAGQVVTYSELAELAKSPRASRAVGSALHRNPIPIFIPCHRVVRKDSTLGGYRAGLRWKRILLNLEKGKSI
ncbi:MAG: methylated-DNA--[protein]-cysteine S-methyltransferase [Candidatus Omnitrophica bacterium]|nr:methylated-DNA--[protein]-cysteine S-methyltransferase [Candidatus Omnitrophota bacterium]